MQCYSLIPIAGQCFQVKELRRLRSIGQAHQVRGQWHLGPRPLTTPGPSAKVTPGPSLRRRACVPLAALAPLLPPSPPGGGALPAPSPQPATATPAPATTFLAPPDDTTSARQDPSGPNPALPDSDIPFLWLMDIVGSIVDHSVQATWGVTALQQVASFLSDPANCNMGSLLPWASAYGSPARFHLYHASLSSPSSLSALPPLGLLAADYGLKALSASGIRGMDVDDWPCVTDPSDLDLLLSHLRHLSLRRNIDTAAQDLLAAGLSADPSPTMPLPTGCSLLGLGDPHLPYTLFEPPQRCMDNLGDRLPLLLTGDPRLLLARVC